MFLELAAGAYLLGQYAYHRWFEDHPLRVTMSETKIPIVKPGASLPIYFGKVRIRQPVLTQIGPPMFVVAADHGMDQAGGSAILYGLDQLYALGIPFQDGINRIHNMWAGDLKMQTPLSVGLETLTGVGGYETPVYMAGPQITDRSDNSAVDYPAGFGLVEFLSGGASQEIVDASGINLSKTYTGDRLSNIPFTPFTPYTDIGGTTPPGRFPAYRGVTSVFLFNGNIVTNAFDTDVTPNADHGYPTPVVIPTGTSAAIMPWIIGATSQVPAYSWETSTYPNHSLDLPSIGEDANPADVLYAIYRDNAGKLGLSVDLVDYESFRDCAEKLRIEGHGFSRVWEDGQQVDAKEIVAEILKQIDGLVYFDQIDGLIKMRLIRPDFDPTTLMVISPENAKLKNPSFGGRTLLTNKLQVIFENREKDYTDDSATADNGANAVGQDGAVRPEVLEFRGIKVAAQAAIVASRELAARSTPLAKFTAITDRSFYRAKPGDRVLVNWPKWNISGMIMIVARVSPGTGASNDMALDLVQDFYYTHRFIVSTDTGLPHHGGSGEVVG